MSRQVVSGTRTAAKPPPAENPAQEIIDFFTSNPISGNLTRQQAVGIAAVLKAESGLSTTARGSEGAYGLAQWLGSRQTALFAYARAAGKSPASKQVQLNFLAHELKTTESTTLKQLQERDTAAGTAEVFLKKFERPATPQADLPKIDSYIRGINAGLSGGTPEEQSAEGSQAAHKKETEESKEGFFERLGNFFEKGLWEGLLNVGVNLLLVVIGAVLVVYGIMVAVRPPDRAFKVPAP